jgi:uncharacterized membrane protein YbhN (UPF0104 family)
MRVWLWRGFSFLAAAALVVVMLTQVDWDSFRSLLASMSAGSLVAGFSIYLLLNYFRAQRFVALLGGDQITPAQVFPIALYHNFLVRLLPFKLGEVTYIVLMRSRHGVSSRDGVSSLFGSRLFELLVIVLVAAAALLLTGNVIPEQGNVIILLVAGSIAVGVLGFYYAAAILTWIAARLSRQERIASRITALAASFERVREPAIFGRALFWSVFTYSCSFGVNLVLLQSAGIQVDGVKLVVIVSLGMFATAFPFNISGFGAVELSWAFGLVQLAGYAPGEATSIGLMLNGLQLIFAALSGMAGYVWLQVKKPAE